MSAINVVTSIAPMSSGNSPETFCPQLDVSRHGRAALKGQSPCVLWFTGLSGAGKSTIANAVELQLTGLGVHTYLLDGDVLRRGLSNDLGFGDENRDENVRRTAEVAKLMVDAGLIVMVSLISPFRAQRCRAREIIGADDFVEIFVDTPLHVAEARDIKGLYRKARSGQLRNFTGVDSPYEVPERPDIHLRPVVDSLTEAAATVCEHLRTRNKFAVQRRE